jgi:hypothetical protein
MTVQDNRAADTSHMNFEPGSWQEAAYELYVGLYVGIAHTIYFGKLFLVDYVSKPAGKALGYAGEEKKRAPKSKGPHELKVIGVGYGRTGTVSIYRYIVRYQSRNQMNIVDQSLFSRTSSLIFRHTRDMRHPFFGRFVQRVLPYYNDDILRQFLSISLSLVRRKRLPCHLFDGIP